MYRRHHWKKESIYIALGQNGVHRFCRIFPVIAVEIILLEYPIFPFDPLSRNTSFCTILNVSIRGIKWYTS